MHCQCGAMINNIPEWLSDAAPVACRDCQDKEKITMHLTKPSSRDSFQLKGSLSSNKKRAERVKERAVGNPGRPKREVQEGHKYCPACQEIKPVGEFGVVISRYDGRNAYCKVCIRAKAAARKPKRDKVVRIVPEGMKYCPACDKDKDINEFWRNTGRPGGRNAICKTCSKERRTRGKAEDNE